MTGEVDADGLVHVPTVPELSQRGLARQLTYPVTDKRDGSVRNETRWEIDPAGYTEMRDAMIHNAEVLKADRALDDRLFHASLRAARGRS